ncbi:group II truncated hemoglobin [Nocardioides speluncae]|uniref:group II truncated hemoglobin n=1 Tax=Nocardioides speluncae TaxID=2670337 RepID=UPI000D693A43|nr:group II truncated hemoglobin [Nocardioides speluncae]
MTETLYEHAGGHAGLHKVIAHWYPTVLADPLLGPLFGEGQPTHVDHLTAFFGEVFDGPSEYTDQHGGFPALLSHHRGLAITEEQRQRFMELFLKAADEVGLPDDARFRQALREYLDFGTEVAMVNSHAQSDADLHGCQEVPRWDWPDAAGGPATGS